MQRHVDRQVLNPGDSFTATGQASGVDAQNHTLASSAFSWSFQWNGLPGTGGPALWILVAGVVLLLGGGGAVAASRRRSG